MDKLPTALLHLMIVTGHIVWDSIQALSTFLHLFDDMHPLLHITLILRLGTVVPSI